MICHAEMEREAAVARYADLHPEGRDYHSGDHRNWGPKSKDRPYKYTDGVTIWCAPADLNAGDKFLAGRDDVSDETIPEVTSRGGSS